jgi:hypothetical protein
MNEFLVELYVSCTESNGADLTIAHAHSAAAELTAAGTPVRFLRSIFVPADEMCLFLFEADSIDAVREAAHRASLPFDHVAETASIPTSPEITQPHKETR